MQQQINIKNKKAYFDFDILEKHIAGVQLTGTEIKSIRQGKARLVDSYCYFDKNEVWLKGMHITPYESGGYINHEPKRDRKLLLKRKELAKLEKKFHEKGLTIVALRLFINDRGIAKVEIGLAKGRQKHDKREYIKERDMKREMKNIKP